MNILVLNGSPRSKGNTVALIEAFKEGAESKDHKVKVINVCKKDISGCKACGSCHKKGKNGECKIKDDMKKVYKAFKEYDVLVVATPIYYFTFTAQLQCAIQRLYAIGKKTSIKKSMLILSAGGKDVFDGAIFEYKRTFIKYMGFEDLGIYTASGKENKSEEKLLQLNNVGKAL